MKSRKICISITALVLSLLSLYVNSKKSSEVSNANQATCLTAHGIHSAKVLGLASPDWEVPKEHICGLQKQKP